MIKSLAMWLSLIVLIPVWGDDQVPNRLAVTFEPDAERVLQQPLDRPVVLVFEADWCGWCRKMNTVTLTDQRMTTIATNFIWLKIDIERQPEIAARFAVRSVPQLVVLNPEGASIGSVGGYLPADRLLQFLADTLESPQEPTLPIESVVQTFLDAEDQESINRSVIELIDRLSRPDRDARRTILEAFQRKGPVVASPLLDLLTHRHLSIRAAANQALREATGGQVPFNAFCSVIDRDAQCQAWATWLQGNSP